MTIKLSIWCFMLSLFLFGCVATGSKTVSMTTRPSEEAVAVWELEDTSPLGAAQPDLAEFISARILETLRDQGVKVVEREKLLSVLRELSLGESELTDPETRLRVGYLSGAKKMVFGGYQVIGKSMRIDLRLVDVETGRILTAAQKTVQGRNLNEWLAAAEEVARDLTAR